MIYISNSRNLLRHHPNIMSGFVAKRRLNHFILFFCNLCTLLTKLEADILCHSHLCTEQLIYIFNRLSKLRELSAVRYTTLNGIVDKQKKSTRGQSLIIRRGDERTCNKNIEYYNHYHVTTQCTRNKTP